jgi:hypothetical protein
MTKKHFTWAAERIIQACLFDDISYEDIAKCPLYWAYRDMFDEFGKNFDVNEFDNYIINELKVQRYGNQ